MPRCYYHPDAEAVGQCGNAECGVYLCRACYGAKRGFCYECARMRKKEGSVGRNTAIVDIILFAVCSVVITTIVFFEGRYDLIYSGSMRDTAILVFAFYVSGAGCLGIKKSLGWTWRKFRSNLISLIILLPVAYVGGLFVGIVIAPYILYKAVDALRL
jgi:hypothetical protein